VMLDVIDLARRYAQSDTTVLITGESGTGKELFAQGIHNESTRASRPFVAINCAGFPESLLESELFGYEEGAFTGTRKGGKPGLFEIAHTGTVFLDEIGEMPISLQTRLLRVLQAREVVRLGGTQPTPIDVRVIAATHRNLKERVASGEFRQDLYYRLNILRLKLPALRERGDDVALLAETLLTRLASGASFKKISVEQIIASLMPFLMRHTWPGNVRELENVMERAAVLLGGSDAQNVGSADLARAIFDDEDVLAASASLSSGKAAVLDLVASRDRVRMLQVIGQCDGNLSMAAKQLGISRSTLWRRLKTSA
jgi:transcriptional regulator, propionate catabolism operon regulatory protein